MSAMLLNVLCVLISGGADDKIDAVRVWHDTISGQEIRATYARTTYKSEQKEVVVVLDKDDGTTASVPLKSLSDEDREFLQRAATARKAERAAIEGSKTKTVRPSPDRKIASPRKNSKHKVGLAEASPKGLAADPEIAQSLEVLNHVRKNCGLEPVTLSETLSDGCFKHSKYLVVNKGNPLIAGLKAHEEHEELPECSPEGAKAGKSAVIHFVSPSHAISGWLGGLYHRIPLLQPKLKEVGIGYFQQNGAWASCIDCISGCAGPNAKDIIFCPDDGQDGVPLKFANEIPCPIPAEHAGPAGFPTTIYFAQGQKITQVSVKFVGANKTPLECYVSTPESPATSFTQWNTVCVIPAQPLTPETKYTVTLKCTVSGVPCVRTWHFTTGP